MNDQEILDNAPEGATEIDDSGKCWIYNGNGDYLLWDDKRWVEGFSPYHTRSLADIRRIVELEQEIKILQGILNEY